MSDATPPTWREMAERAIDRWAEGTEAGDLARALLAAAEGLELSIAGTKAKTEADLIALGTLFLAWEEKHRGRVKDLKVSTRVTRRPQS